MNKKMLALIMLIFVLTDRVKADCSYSDIAKMRNLVGNINISYSHSSEEQNQMLFDVTINNITDDMYFIDENSRKTYTYQDTTDGEITIRGYDSSYIEKGTYTFYSSNDECYGKKLGTKYYNFPIFNIYYQDPICYGFENVSLCQKWVTNRYSRSELKQKLGEYMQTNDENSYNFGNDIADSIIEFLAKYYYYAIGIIIVLLACVAIYKRKDDKFDY